MPSERQIADNLEPQESQAVSAGTGSDELSFVAWGPTAHTDMERTQASKTSAWFFQGAVPNTLPPQHFKVLPQSFK